jgi:hypothetical protein
MLLAVTFSSVTVRQCDTRERILPLPEASLSLWTVTRRRWKKSRKLPTSGAPVDVVRAHAAAAGRPGDIPSSVGPVRAQGAALTADPPRGKRGSTAAVARPRLRSRDVLDSVGVQSAADSCGTSVSLASAACEAAPGEGRAASSIAERHAADGCGPERLQAGGACRAREAPRPPLPPLP